MVMKNATQLTPISRERNSIVKRQQYVQTTRDP